MARSRLVSRGLNLLLLAASLGLSATAAMAQDVIKFGAPLPLTGPLAPEAIKQQQGYDLWAEQANKAGGISVGGMVANRKFFGAMIAGVDHLSHTYNRAEQAYSRGEPKWGGHLADELERLVALHDASTIAAVIVEPVAGSTGVILTYQSDAAGLREQD